MSGGYLERLRVAADTPIMHGADGLTLAPMAVVAQNDLRDALAELDRLRKDVAKLGEHVAPVDDREPMNVNWAAEALYAYAEQRSTQSQFGNQLRAVLDSRQSWRYRAFKLEDDVEQMRADNAALLDGNQQLQVMNDGLRQMAIEAREAANGWHQATIDLYSGRSEPDPTGEEDRGA